MDVSINGARILATFENVPLFGTINITQTLLVSWIVMALLTGICVWLGHGLSVENPSRKQAAAETLVVSLQNFVRGNMGEKFDKYIPLVGTIFATSIISNLMGLLGLWSPTADLSVELGWALVVFVLITYHKLKAGGLLGYLRGFLDPIFLFAPLNVISEVSTPVSMACRHFGNILSGTVISTLVYAALAAASHALLGLLGANIVVAAAVTVAGVALLVVGNNNLKAGVVNAKGKPKGKGSKILGIIFLILGILSMLSLLPGALGETVAAFPWLDIGIPAVASLYFDWFSGCIQAFIFCTLTTIFIKQAAGEE